MTSPTIPNLELISKATSQENNDLKRLVATKNNEIEDLKSAYKKQSQVLLNTRQELQEARNKLTALSLEGKFVPKISQLVS